MYQGGVIGLGNIGFKFRFDPKRKKTWTHVEAYKKCAATKLVGAVEIDPETIQAFRKIYPSIPVYNSINDLFNHHRIDLVSICVPTKDHFSIFSQIIKYDLKAIFCEKPLSYSLAESKKMLNLARRKRVVLAVNYTRRWQDSYNLVKEMVKVGKIGRLKVINCFYPNRIYNIGSHLLDTLLMLSDAVPVSVNATYIERTRDPSLSGWLKLKNKNRDIFASFSSTGKREDLIFEIDIIADQGRIRISDNGSKIEWFIFKKSKRYSGYRELIPEKIKIPVENDSFVDAISDIVDVLEQKQKSPRCSGKDGLLVDEIIEKAIISANKKGLVKHI